MTEQLDPEIAELLKDELGPKVKEEEYQEEIFGKLGNFFDLVVEKENSEYVQKVKEHINAILSAKTKEERTLYKSRLITSYWSLYSSIAIKVGPNLPIEKRLFLRFGMLEENLLTPEQQKFFHSIPLNKKTDYSIYYVDEWLHEIGSGKIKPSMVDEVEAKKSDTQPIKEKLDRKIGTREAEIDSLKKKVFNRDIIEKEILSLVNKIITHQKYPQYGNLAAEYTADQKSALTQIIEDVQKLKTLDKQIEASYKELNSLDEEIADLKSNLVTADKSSFSIDKKIIEVEMNSLRQMAKMCIGPQGNHYPLLSSEYAPKYPDLISTPENVTKILKEIEELDPNVFIRTFKNEDHRIVPYIILVPCYGDEGICWEPFDIKNRATSKGRIVIPLYPKNVKIAILTALGDLRWQISKEKAAYRWMEEGLTGKYYDYFTTNKIRGDIKEYFIKDYITWIMYESNGTQKLDKNVRMIFWREIPFPQWKKEELKNRGFYYMDLYQRDIRRSMSDL